MKFVLLTVLVLMPKPAAGKERPRILIQVVNSASSQREFTYTTPGGAGHSDTTCDSNATAVDLGNVTSVNGSTNCRTATTAPTPPQTTKYYIAQVHAFAVLPDGTHVTLWCQRGFRDCRSLAAGKYAAEIDGNSLLVIGHEVISGKEKKIKFHAVGGW